MRNSSLQRRGVVFVDRLQWASFTRVLFLGASVDLLWHVEPLSRSARWWLWIARGLGLLRAEVRQVPYHLGEAREADGESLYVRLLREARAICVAIKHAHLTTHPLIAGLEPRWARSRVVCYFEKLIEEEVTQGCFRIGLVAWMLRHGTTDRISSPGVLLVGRTRWFSSLAAYADRQGVRVIGYTIPGPGVVVQGLSVVRRLLREALSGIAEAWDVPRPRQDRSDDRRPGASRRGVTALPTIAIRYWYRTLSVNPVDRSEFFWLNSSTLAGSAIILLYCPERPVRADAATLRPLEAQGIRVLQRGPHLTIRSLAVSAPIIARLVRQMLVCVAKGQRVWWYDVRALAKLAYAYGCWYTFLSTHKVKVHVAAANPQATDVAMALALDALEGVSLTYQYSIANLFQPTTFLSAGEHVQCVFSPLCEQMWRSLEAPVEQFVPTGFIYDSAFAAIRRQDRAARVRQQLRSQGVQFILCFFDENSMDRWDTYASHEGAARDYEYLLKWLLADPTLGVICKVKKSLDVFQRIGRVVPLIEQAQRTGRCQLLMSRETLVGSIFPAEAAMMADLCVGKLSGSTAALEAQLAGTPTLLIDTEGFRRHPFRATLGDGRVIFDDWDSLRAAVERYRQAPTADPAFGRWSPLLDQLDPFRDGRASERMASYIGWLLEGFHAGLDRGAAMAHAIARYHARWGDGRMAQRSPGGEQAVVGSPWVEPAVRA